MKLALHIRLMTVEAVRALARHRLRTGLAMLGNMVGVASVVWVIGIGRAGAERTLRELDQLGTNVVWVQAGSRNVAGVRTGALGMTSLTPRDAQAIRDEIPLCAQVSEEIDGNVQIALAGHNWNTRYRGVAANYPSFRHWEIASGGFFTDDDVQRAARVVVIGETVRQELFGEDDPLGEMVRIRGAVFEVIGVFAPNGQSAWGNDQDDAIWTPWTTAQRYVIGKDQRWLDWVTCSAVSPEAIPDATDQIEALLRQRHHLQEGGDDDFTVRHLDEEIKALHHAAETLDLLLFCLAVISLLIGGIGIMNVMLASVMQRTREIGIRMAVGASATAIQVQFLGESLVITVVSGAGGIGLALAGAPWIERTLGWTVHVPPDAATLAILFSVGVGVGFGLYPAMRASRVDPIDALHNQ